MTTSNSFTRTTAYTFSEVRYVNDKIASDLHYLHSLAPSILSSDRVEKWKGDVYQWIYNGYAETVKIQFKRDGICIREIQYQISYDGYITGDDKVGRLSVKGLENSSPSIQISPTEKWNALSPEEKQKFYENNLSPGWGNGNGTKYADGLILRTDKQYSKGAIGVQRSVLGG